MAVGYIDFSTIVTHLYGQLGILQDTLKGCVRTGACPSALPAAQDHTGPAGAQGGQNRPCQPAGCHGLAVAPHCCAPARLPGKRHVAAQAPGCPAPVWKWSRQATLPFTQCGISQMSALKCARHVWAVWVALSLSMRNFLPDHAVIHCLSAACSQRPAALWHAGLCKHLKMRADPTLLHAAGDDDLRESLSAQWFRARLQTTKKEAGQEADHFMQMSAPEPVAITAKPYIQVSKMAFPCNSPHGCMCHLGDLRCSAHFRKFTER